MPSSSRRAPAIAALIMAACPPAAVAQEKPIELAAGPGRETVQAACGMCHSLDYVVINSPFLDRAGWERTVRKMTSVMGAPLTDEQVATVVEYLSRYYARP